jgi:hypothetical protein
VDLYGWSIVSQDCILYRPSFQRQWWYFAVEMELPPAASWCCCIQCYSSSIRIEPDSEDIGLCMEVSMVTGQLAESSLALTIMHRCFTQGANNGRHRLIFVLTFCASSSYVQHGPSKIVQLYSCKHCLQLQFVTRTVKPNEWTERDLTESLGPVQGILAFRRARAFLHGRGSTGFHSLDSRGMQSLKPHLAGGQMF